MSIAGTGAITELWAKVKALVGTKQDALVSGTNIKTVNGNSLLGSGNIAISGGDSYHIQSNSVARVVFGSQATTTSNARLGISSSQVYDPASIGCFYVDGNTVNLSEGYVYKVTAVIGFQGTSTHSNVAAELQASDYAADYTLAGGLWSPVKTTTCYGQVVLEGIYAPSGGYGGEVYVVARSTSAGATVGANSAAYMVVECLGPMDPSMAWANGVSF